MQLLTIPTKFHAKTAPSIIEINDLFGYFIPYIKRPYIYKDVNDLIFLKNNVPHYCLSGHQESILNDYEVYGRSKQNHSIQYGITLDYDGDLSFMEIGNLLESYGYRFLLYSSPSYSYKEGDRCRVIIPMDIPIDTETWDNPQVKKALLEHFHEDDQSAFDTFRFFAFPCLLTPDSPYYYRIQTEGKSFDLSSLNVDLSFPDITVTATPRDISMIEDESRRAVAYVRTVLSQEDINHRGGGNGINDLIKRMNMKMKGAGMSSNDRASIIMEFATNPITIREIERLTKN